MMISLALKSFKLRPDDVVARLTTSTTTSRTDECLFCVWLWDAGGVCFFIASAASYQSSSLCFPPQHTLPAWSDCVCCRCRCRCFHVHYEALVVFRLVFSSSSLSWAALSTWLCLECSQFVETQQCEHPPVPLPHPDPPASQSSVHLAPWASWLKDFSARWWNYDKWRA